MRRISRCSALVLGIALVAAMIQGCAADESAPALDGVGATTTLEFDPGEDYDEASNVPDGPAPTDDELFDDANDALATLANETDDPGDDDEEDAVEDATDGSTSTDVASVPADDPSRERSRELGLLGTTPDALLDDGKLVGTIARKNDVYYAANPLETLTNLWLASRALRPNDAPAYLALAAKAVALHLNGEWRPKGAGGKPKELGAHLFGRAVARFAAELARAGIAEVAVDPPVAGLSKLTVRQIHDVVYAKALSGRPILSAAAHLASHDAMTALALAYVEKTTKLPRKVSDGAIAARNALVKKHLFTPATNGRLLWGSTYRREAYFCSDQACNAIAKGCHHMGGMELANVDVSNPCGCGVPDTSHANAVVGYALFAERFSGGFPTSARFSLDLGRLATTAQSIVKNRAAFIDGFDNVTVPPSAKKNAVTLRDYPENTRKLDIASHRRVIAASGVGAWAALAADRGFYSAYVKSVWKPSQRCFKATPIGAPNRCGARSLSPVAGVSGTAARAGTASWMLYGATRAAGARANEATGTRASCVGKAPGRYCEGGVAFDCTETGFMSPVAECDKKTCATDASGAVACR